MSTEQIYKGFPERYSSLERDTSVQKIQRTKFKIKRRLGQLENKACFFQGQLNPITIENKVLKDKLVELNRAVSASSDLLRNLLPVQNDPTRKLKLQIASLEEISAMIKEDWIGMEESIRCMKRELAQKGNALLQLEDKYLRTVGDYQSKLEIQKIGYQAQIAQLKSENQALAQKIEQITLKARLQKQQLINSYTDRLAQAQNSKKQFQKYISQMRQKCQNYERVAQRLRQQIAHNLLEFEKSKQNIKQIYEGLMQSKLDQQNKQFEYLLKMKEEQKIKIMEEMALAAEELKKIISVRNSEINHLGGINDKLKEEIGAIKDEIWKHKIELDKCHKDIKGLEEKLYFQLESNKSLKLKIDENEDKINQIETILKKNKEQYEKQILAEKNRVKQLETRIIEEKEAFEKKLQESEVKLQETKRKLRENDQKFQERLDEQKRKFEEQIAKFEQEQKVLRQQLEQETQKLKQKQEQITKIIRKNETQKHRLQQQHQAKLKRLQAQHSSTLKRLTQQSDQKLKLLTRDHQLKLSQLEISNNEYVRKLMADHSMKMYEQENRYKMLEENSEKERRELQTQLADVLGSNKRLMEEREEIGEKLKRAEEEFRRGMEEQRKENQRRLEQEKEKYMNEMRDQILQFKKAMDQKQESFKTQLSQMKQSLEKQIKMLKQTNAIESVEQKYNEMLSKLKQQMDAQAKRLEEEKAAALAQAAQVYNNQLLLLSKKLEFDISKLNEELINQKQSHQFDKMTREEKINFLIFKINGYRAEMEEKDTKIFDLYFEIDKKNKELERIDEIVAEKTKKIKFDFQQQLLEAKAQFQFQTKALKSECQAKIKKIQTERIQFTQSIYQQFQDLKVKYDQELERITRKYNQLERIFEERPSRAEDLSKIKQLIQQRSKMDLEIKQCKKKVKEANQIVKYLNLELQNYKDSYDIFGPGGQPLSPERRFHTETDSPVRSMLRRDTIISQDSRKQSGETPDLNQFRLFPPLGRNTSQAVVEEDNESQASQKGQYYRKRPERQKPMLNNRIQAEDKSQQLRSNASVFLNLISRDQKLPIEKSINNGYSKRLSRRKTVAISYDKRLQIKDKTLILEQ